MPEETPEQEFARLVKTIRGCTMCNIPPPAYPIVTGPYGAKVMTVGQCPGERECEQGRPFAGQAGKALFAWFASVGIDEERFRARAYMTAVTKCYPAPDKKGRRETPLPHEVTNCAPYLVRELRLVHPKVIIPIGVMAIQRLLGKVRLEDAVGRTFERRYHSFDTLVIPLPHPSGRSVWQYMGENKRLLKKALGEIGSRCKAYL